MSRPSLSVVSCGPVDTAVNSTACIAATAAVLHRADACCLLVKFHPRAPTGMRTLHMMYVPQDFAQTAEKCAQSLCWSLKIASQRCSERNMQEWSQEQILPVRSVRAFCSPFGWFTRSEMIHMWKRMQPADCSNCLVRTVCVHHPGGAPSASFSSPGYFFAC